VTRIRQGGRIVTVVLDAQLSPVHFKTLVLKEAEIVASRCTAGEFAQTTRMMAKGLLHPELLITHEIPLREVGAAVSLAANASRVLAHLGLGERLARLSTEPARLIHRDGRDGRQIAATPGPRWYRETFGGPFASLHRADLQILLADALGPGHLHLGCQAEKLEEAGAGMRVLCSSGTVFEAGLVVGADGVHSLVRDWVTGGDEPVYSGTSGFRGLVPVERLDPSLPDVEHRLDAEHRDEPDPGAADAAAVAQPSIRHPSQLPKQSPRVRRQGLLVGKAALLGFI